MGFPFDSSLGSYPFPMSLSMVPCYMERRINNKKLLEADIFVVVSKWIIFNFTGVQEILKALVEISN